MQLALWTYEAPPHVGAMRVATAMEGLHYVLHAPQGDTYADLLFTMIERLQKRPPVTYTTFQARDLGSDTAELFKTAALDAYERFRPEAMIVGASCTAELIQDDPGGLARALALPIPVVPLDLPAYQKKENWGAAETFYQLVRTLAAPAPTSPLAGEVESVAAAADRVRGGASPDGAAPSPGGLSPTRPLPQGERSARVPRANILGPTALGFRHRDDVVEITRLLGTLGIEVNVTAPLGARPADLGRLGEADFNVVLYPEVAGLAARWLEKTYGQQATKTVPIGVSATRDFIHEVAALASVDPAPALAGSPSRLPWYSRSVDSNYLTGKRVFIFGDATHAIAAARIASAELGFAVVGLGTYSREYARDVREAAKAYGVEALITDDYLEVEAAIAELQPELVLGTQMERHVAKRLGIPCTVISAPVHVQDFPARYSPQMGFEGANVIFDSWVHPLMMGLEEHLVGMFREDTEFRDEAPSHLGSAKIAPHAEVLAEGEPRSTHQRGASFEAALRTAPQDEDVTVTAQQPIILRSAPTWSPDAERELGKIPFFVRGKARRNTETFARDQGLALVTIETLYDAKAHFGR